MNRILIFLVSSVLFAAFTAEASAQNIRQLNKSNMILTAVEAYEKGDYSKAEKWLSQVTAIDKENDAAWYYLALCAVADNDAELAEAYFSRAAEIDPGNFWYRYRLATLFAVTGRPDEAIAQYERLLKDFPQKSDLYLEIVELYASAGKNEKALETISEIETVFGVTESTTVYKYNLLRDLGREDEAIEHLKTYNNRYSSPYVLSILAEHYWYSYDETTALACYNEALELIPDYSPALLGKAEVLRMTAKYDDFFETLNKFVLNPGDQPSRKVDYLTAVFKSVEPRILSAHMAQMDSVMENTIRCHEADTSVNQLVGVYYYSTDRPERAREVFHRNLVLNTDVLSSHAYYHNILMNLSQWEELSVEARKSYEKFPKELEFLRLAAFADQNLERYDKVIEAYDEILSTAPGDTILALESWAAKGDVYFQMDEPKKAFKAYEKALKIKPDYIYVLNNYAYYLSLQGKDLKKACQMSRKTVEAEPDDPTYLDTYGWILYLMGKPEEARTHFKRAMLYGGKESAVILDHYAEVLFALGEYDKAMVYWNSAMRKNNGEIEDLEERISERKRQMKKKL